MEELEARSTGSPRGLPGPALATSRRSAPRHRRTSGRTLGLVGLRELQPLRVGACLRPGLRGRGAARHSARRVSCALCLVKERACAQAARCERARWRTSDQDDAARPTRPRFSRPPLVQRAVGHSRCGRSAHRHAASGPLPSRRRRPHSPHLPLPLSLAVLASHTAQRGPARLPRSARVAVELRQTPPRGQLLSFSRYGSPRRLDVALSSCAELPPVCTLLLLSLGPSLRVLLALVRRRLAARWLGSSSASTTVSDGPRLLAARSLRSFAEHCPFIDLS